MMVRRVVRWRLPSCTIISTTVSSFFFIVIRLLECTVSFFVFFRVVMTTYNNNSGTAWGTLKIQPMFLGICLLASFSAAISHAQKPTNAGKSLFVHYCLLPSSTRLIFPSTRETCSQYTTYRAVRAFCQERGNFFPRYQLEVLCACYSSLENDNEYKLKLLRCRVGNRVLLGGTCGRPP